MKAARSRLGASLVLALISLVAGSLPSGATTAPQSLPFTQDWTNTGLITLDDDWSGVPGITGYRGDDLTTLTGTDPQTITADGSATPQDVNANQLNPDTFITGGVAEFHIADPVVALQGSGTADAPQLVFTLDTTGSSDVTVAYDLRDIDGSADNAVQPVALQYRVGVSGNYTNVPAGFVADASTGPSLATLTTHVNVVLPAAVDDQPLVQVRVMTTNAAGSDEWIGVDNVSVTGTSTPGAPTLVLSQIYGGGGNTNAPFNHDFIELFNPGDAGVSLAGLSLQSTSATGTALFGADSSQLTELTGTIPAHSHFLVQEATGGAVGVDLPAPDQVDATPINMANASGKVALVSGTASLGCNGGPTASTPCDDAALARIIDLVGYGIANFFEGSAAAPGASNTTSVQRERSGCQDTNDNAADFTSAAPVPRNSTVSHGCETDEAPVVSSRSPAGQASDVAVAADVTITFSEPVDVSGSWYSISCATSGAHSAVVSGGPTTFTLNPDADFAASETCTVTVFAANVTDQDTNDPPDNMAANDVWSFTTIAPPVPIHDIQGASHTSPKVGQAVSNVNGIVTAKRSNGFYMQDPNPDADDATSEGIFVFTASSPTSVNVGDAVRVSGNVAEFRPGGSSSANLTTTEITGPTTTVLSSGNPLPGPTVVGIGGRVPPSMIIDNDSFGAFDPGEDGIDFYESLEGMRIQVNNPVVVGPRNNFGEIFILGDDGANAAARTARSGIVIRPNDFNPERIQLDDAILAGSTPNASVGDHFNGPAVGVLDYDFGNFELNLTSALTTVPGGLTREVTAERGADQLAVATFNVENLDANEPQAKFDALAGQIVNNLRSPDVIALEEIQDNNGATNDSVVDADQTLDKLVAAIQAAGGPAYDWRQINPVDDQDGGEPGGNIRVGFLFRTDRGLAFVDRPGGGSTTPTTVVSGPNGPELSSSPGRVDPANGAWSSSRKPLAAEFTFYGETVFMIANHFNSKGGDNPLFGRFQPPVRSTETQRHQQAQVVNDFVDSILAVNAEANVVVLGDINDFEFSDTMTILEGGGVLHDLMNTLPQDERYSYVFEGNSQTLDHIVVSDGLFASPFEFDPVHINAEFFDQLSDHDPSVARSEVPVTSAGLCNLVRSYSTDPNVADELCDKLAKAEGATTPTARAGHLTAFRNQVDAKTGAEPGKAFTSEQGARLKHRSLRL